MRKTIRLTGLAFQNFFLFMEEEDIPALETAQQLFEELDTAESLSCWMLVKYGEFRQLVEKKLRDTDFDDSSPRIFERSYQAVSYLSKYPFLPTGIDRRQVALSKFLEAEERCKETNSRMRLLRDSPHKVDSRFREVFHLAVGKISRILGAFDGEEFLRSGGWGPGATNVAKGTRTSGYNKFSGPLSVTANCLPYAVAHVSAIPLWAQYHVCRETPDEFESSRPVSPREEIFEVVPGGSVRFVPKNAKTDRSIIIPVHLNSYCQKALGRMLRRRLKHVGVDLDDQSRNQQLAYRGSLDTSLATIDLEAASDTIARLLPALLIEQDQWYKALEGTREPVARLPDGSWIRFEKFSAMGNSFTFELESLIFYALVWASVKVIRSSSHPVNQWTGKEYPWTVSVYGDDIVCPTDCVDGVIEVLRFFGFTPNTSKTHVDGVFRESCGMDYFAGHLVRPVFLKERLTSEEAIIKASNALRRLAFRRNRGCGCDASLYSTWYRLSRRLSRGVQTGTGIPLGCGDGGLLKSFDEFCPKQARREIGWVGYWAVGIVHTPVKAQMWQYGPALADYLQDENGLPPLTEELLVETDPQGWLNRLSADPREEIDALFNDKTTKDGEFALRGRTRSRLKRMYRLDWPDIGPWV